MTNRRLFALLTLALTACEADTLDGAEPATDTVAGEAAPEGYAYSGPGSYWTADFDAVAGTFHIEVSPNAGGPLAYEMDGTYAASGGWSLLTVTQGTGDGAPEAGERLLGIEIPGFAFLLRPFDDSYNSVVPMLVDGDCPTADESLNWMIAQGFGDKDAFSEGDDFFGTYTYKLSDHTAEVTARYALEDYTLLEEAAHSLTLDACDGGVMSIETEYTVAEGLPAVNLWMVPGGAMVETFHRDNGEDVTKQTMLALHAEEITMGAVASQTFIGMHFSAPSTADTELSGADDAAVGQIQEIEIVFDSDGIGTAATITDVETGETGEGGATLIVEALNTPTDGFFTATLSAGEGAEGNVACAVATDMGDANQTMVTCVGQSPEEEGGAFTMTLASQ